ncbi:MAG: U32 family peptidase, partial [Planctomycetes bacterium]|nr:U32 family peptidase [Planctomycetota bacterium]
GHGRARQPFRQRDQIGPFLCKHFGAEAQSAAPHLPRLMQAGIFHYRLEFAHETREEVRRVAHAFRAGLSGELSAGELESRLAAIAPQGVTEGSLFIPDNYTAIPLL